MNKQYTFILSLFIALFFTSNHLCAQIQTQIDNANSGDVILIAEGTYDETLVINKSITLQADGAVILNVAGFVTGISIQNNISNVNIDGFTIIGDVSTGSGITVSPGANNIMLSNNTIEDILLPGGGNASPLSYGILCWGDTDPINPPFAITINNNIISNVLGSGISLGSNTENVLISNNTFSNIIPVDLTGLGNFASIGVQAELSSGLGIQNNTYNDLTISNNLISCTDTYISTNTYNNSNLMLSTSYPHNISFNDTPWWSTTWSDGVNYYEAYYNDPSDVGYLYWVSLGVFTQNELIPGCQDESACNYNSSATEDDGSCDYPAMGTDCAGDCLEGYTQLTLMWSGAVDASMMTSFSVSGSINGELYSAMLDTDSGSMTECWMTDLQADCFSIEIEGPDGLEWSVYSPLSDDPFLTGTNESMVMGSECTMGCMDVDACNYDSSAQMDDGSCDYPAMGTDCAGECLEGYTQLTLMWSGAVADSMMTSFSVSGSINGGLYGATLDADSGSMTECWMTDLQADCFSIEIEGPDGLEWSLYSPLSDDPFLTGTNESMVMGSACTMGCMDVDACNYDSSAQMDDGSCEYAASNADCNGDCLEGYTQLTLMWSGAVADSMMTSFSVSGSINGGLYGATLDADSGSMTECWMTDLQADCFSIEIEGPDGLEWSLYSPLSDDPFLTGTNESMVFGSQCVEIWGCTDLEACNYNELATDDDASCVFVTVENNIQCDECCMYSAGLWTYLNPFYLASSDTPTLSATGDNWELSSSAFLYSEETINEDGSVSTISWHGADEANASILTGDCFTGPITVVLIFKMVDDVIVGDIVIKMFDDADMYFETITSVDSFDLTTATMTGTIEAGNSGTLVMIDSDGNGVGDCDESTYIQESDISARKLIKTINLLGQDVNSLTKNSVLLYMYDNGTVEKKNQLH